MHDQTVDVNPGIRPAPQSRQEGLLSQVRGIQEPFKHRVRGSLIDGADGQIAPPKHCPAPTGRELIWCSTSAYRL